MTRLGSSLRTLGTMPLRAGPIQALLEAGIGCGALLLLARMASLVGGALYALTVVLTSLAWLCMGWWPAWRLRRVRGRRWYLRLAKGLPRALLIAGAAGAVGTLLDGALWEPTHALNAGGIAVIAALFLVARPIAVFGSVLARRARRRLRWQLMASHVGVVVLTFVTLTALGSVVGLVLLVIAIRPAPTAMAQSVAEDVRLANPDGVLSAGRTQGVLREIMNESLPLRGEPRLVGLAAHELIPNPILVLTPDARLVTGRDHDLGALPLHGWSDVVGFYATGAGRPKGDASTISSYAATWSRLRRAALAGLPVDISAPHPGIEVARGTELAEAPIPGPSGKTIALVVLDVPQFDLSARQLFAGALAIFGVATVVLVVVAAIPLLGLSFLFSYLLARSLTGRLESVSRVAASIASGDFAQRAPVPSRNEIGQLARTVNRMAVRLDATVGELREARTQAEEALSMRQQLVANISHELRTPLAILRAHLEGLLARNPVPAGTGPGEGAEVVVSAATLHALQSETERLESLVDDLFALSRAQAGALQLQREPVDVAALVDEVAALMRPLVQRDHAVALSVEAQPGLPYALADADRLRQILANLVRNAVRHTPDGGIIALSVVAEVDWLIVAVADTGEGVPPEHLPHLFDRFYRVDEARSRSSGGTGLGLAIVREFVELMDGRVTVESTPGEGTCFRVFLPRATRWEGSGPAPRA